MNSKPETLLEKLGSRLARALRRPVRGCETCKPIDVSALATFLIPGDCILVEGDQRVSTAIKYLTQSTWSHSAMYVGMKNLGEDAAPVPAIVETELGEGCIISPLARYGRFNIRICRPSGLPEEGRNAAVAFMLSHVGDKYDLRNMIDLLRWFCPTPPVPVRWRRRMIAFGSGDPTRAICSSLMARAYQSVGYPILPRIETVSDEFGTREILHIRHHSLFVPRDFDLSPWFEVMKPSVLSGYDINTVQWSEASIAQRHDAHHRPA